MENLISAIAKKHGVSEREVENSLRQAMLEGMKNRNKNETSRLFWNRLSPNNEVPRLSDFITALTRMLPHN